VSTGRLVADATEIQDMTTWAKSRGINLTGMCPVGERPVPGFVEQGYPHEPGYVLQKDVDVFFD
jgi:hypothetical protein